MKLAPRPAAKSSNPKLALLAEAIFQWIQGGKQEQPAVICSSTNSTGGSGSKP